VAEAKTVIPERKEKKGMGVPTHSQENLKAREAKKEGERKIVEVVERAKERQEMEMKKITLGACLGRKEYRGAWEEIGGLGLLETGITLKWNWRGPPTWRGVRAAIVKTGKGREAYK
jgi:hypothetical protein